MLLITKKKFFKRVALLEYLIKTYTDKGDLILDNCMGSGSAALASLNLSRDFIGIEINEKYYEVSCKRLLKEWKKNE